MVESRVEDEDNFRAFIVDDRMCFLVPQNGNSKPVVSVRLLGSLCMNIRDEPAFVSWISFQIEILDMLRLVQRINIGIRERIDARKCSEVLSSTSESFKQRELRRRLQISLLGKFLLSLCLAEVAVYVIQAL